MLDVNNESTPGEQFGCQVLGKFGTNFHYRLTTTAD
jgi:hypothetical protein